MARYRTVLGALILVVTQYSAAFAAGVIVTWSPNSEYNLQGYKVHIGTSSRQYTRVIDVGNITQYEVGQLEEDTRYYVAVTAYNSAGMESDFSPEGSAVASGPGGTIPSGLRWYFAEGATGEYFDTYILVVNPQASPAQVRFTFLKMDGTTVVRSQTIGPRSRYTMWVDQIPGLENTGVSTVVESMNAVPVVAERAMYWGAWWQGGHSSAGVAEPSPRWFFAEGATGMFDLYLLVANPNATPVDVDVTYLLPDGWTWTERHTVAATSRYNIHVNRVPGLENTSVSAVIQTVDGQPVIAERAMYWGPGWIDGHNSPGVTEAAPEWILAEGDTEFADTYILVANPSWRATTVRLKLLRTDAEPYIYDVWVAPTSRMTVEIDSLPGMEGETFGAVVTSLDAVPIVVERAMYWGPWWMGGHNSTGTSMRSARWYLAEGATGGVFNFQEWILVVNPSAADTTVRMTFMGEDGSTTVRDFPLAAQRRLSLNVNELFVNRSTSTTVESTNGVEIVVERSMYWDQLRYGGHNAMGVVIR